MSHNHLANRCVKTIQNTSRNGCRFLSVCYSAPTKGWKKTVYGCRAHINLIGKNADDVCIASVQLKHTCEPEDSQRQRNYRMQDIAGLSKAVLMYHPTATREGNVKQLSSITKASTGLQYLLGALKPIVPSMRKRTILSKPKLLSTCFSRTCSRFFVNRIPLALIIWKVKIVSGMRRRSNSRDAILPSCS